MAHVPALQTILLAVPRGRPPPDGPQQLWEWIEAHSELVYPAVAICILGLIIGAALAFFRSEELGAEKAGQLKREIMLLLRRRVSGVGVDQVAAELQIDRLVAGRLLSELEQEGMISGSGTAPVQYRIRGRQ
jgi:hypothetical protein